MAAIVLIALLVRWREHRPGAFHELPEEGTRIDLSREDELPFSADDVRVFFPDSRTVTDTGQGIYAVEDADSRKEGFIVHGPPADADATGYAGRVPFLVGLDREFRIKGVHMLPSRETDYYARQVAEELKDAWTSLTPDQALEADVDAVSGATHTSEGLIGGVRETMIALGAEPLDEPETLLEAVGPQMMREILTLLFLAVALAYFFLPFSSRRMRLALKAFSVLIPGLLTAAFLSLPFLAGMIRGHFAPSRQWLLLAIAFCAVAVPLLTGRNFYCSSFCPYGAAQDLAGKLSRKKWRTGKTFARIASVLRVILLASAASVILTGAAVDLSHFEPFTAFTWTFAGWPSRLLAVAFLLIAVRIPRAWCRLCPTGNIIGAFRIKKRTNKKPQ